MQKFLFTLKYSKEIPNEDEEKDPTFKKVSELFITEAVNYTDVEVIANKIAERNSLKDFVVTPISKSNISSIAESDEDEALFYDVTVEDEFEQDNGKLKKFKIYVLLEATSIDNALKLANEQFDDSEILKVSKSNVVEFVDSSEMNLQS